MFRKVARGTRFAVAGETSDWLRNTGLRQGLPQQVLIAIGAAASGGDSNLAEKDRPVWYREGEALVNTDVLHRSWCALTGDRSPPSKTALANAVAAVSHQSSRPGNISGRPRVSHICALKVLEVSELLGLGDPDAIRENFSLPVKLAD